MAVAIKKEVGPTLGRYSLALVILFSNYHDIQAQSTLISTGNTFITTTQQSRLDNANVTKCIKDLGTFLSGLLNGEMYAIRMLDSAGKFPSGFLDGNFKWIGSFQECLDVKALKSENTNMTFGSLNTTFDGRFCTVDVTLSFGLPLQIGLCIPDSCSADDLTSLLNREPMCNDTCTSSNNGECLDGGIGSARCGGLLPRECCEYGSDCTDCGPRRLDLSQFVSLPPFMMQSRTTATVNPTSIISILNSAVVEEVYCTSKLEISELTKAIGLLSVAGFFLIMVIIGTLLDIIDAYRKPANRTSDDKAKKNGSVDLVKMNSFVNKATREDGDGMHMDENYQDLTGAYEKPHESFYEGIQTDSVIEDYCNQTEVVVPEKKSTPASPDEEEEETVTENLACFRDFMSNFSLKRNADYIQEEWSSPPVPYLKGIYVLSIWWMILALSWEVDDYSDNIIQLLYTGERLISQSITFYTFAWDTLFLVSGFLITYITLEELNNKTFNVFIFWARRILKMNALYLYFRYFWAFNYEYFIGPLYRDEVRKTTEICTTYWWTYLMFWNNIIPFPGNNNEDCFHGSWYLANLMQFYCLSPIFIYLLHKSWKIGLAVVCAFIAGCLTCLAVLSWYYGLSPSLLQEPYNDNGISGVDYIYNKPYTRCAPFLVGIILGFIIQRHGKKIMKFNVNSVNLIWYGIGWAVAIATGLSLVYGLYGTWHGNELSQAVSVFYLTVSRFAWALAVGWMIFACATGYGGPINAFLSWKAWNPLANLSYAAYLIYPIVIQISLTWRERLVHVQDYPIFYLFVGHTGFTYAYALILAMLIETPLLQMHKKFLRKKHIDVF